MFTDLVWDAKVLGFGRFRRCCSCVLAVKSAVPSTLFNFISAVVIAGGSEDLKSSHSLRRSEKPLLSRGQPTSPGSTRHGVGGLSMHV